MGHACFFASREGAVKIFFFAGGRLFGFTVEVDLGNGVAVHGPDARAVVGQSEPELVHGPGQAFEILPGIGKTVPRRQSASTLVDKKSTNKGRHN